LGAALVEAHVGGRGAHRSDLTDLGRALVEEFDRLRTKMAGLLAKEFPTRLQRLLERE
jgi:molybdate transport repressor ModE-like protein